jgi:hypothetical protein
MKKWREMFSTGYILSGTYPKRTPPNATNNPIIIAGAAEPTASSGLFKALYSYSQRQV